MANVQSNPSGSFCWIELGTTDQSAAKSFYGSLLGWGANDSPMGPDAYYTLFQIDGRNVAGGYTLDAEMRKAGVPPNWILYISVTSADDTAAKAKANGANIRAEPFDVMDLGRMAILQDPTGATIALWEPKSHKGIAVEGVPGTLCWADLSTPDQAAAAKFYEAVFGWKTDPGQDNSGYLHIKNGDKYIGGIPPAHHRDPKVPPHWLAYISVENCDRSTEEAKKAGAKVYFGPMTMENVGRWSIIADPQGAVFALFQSTH